MSINSEFAAPARRARKGTAINSQFAPKRDIPTNNGKINRAALKRGVNKRGKWGV